MKRNEIVPCTEYATVESRSSPSDSDRTWPKHPWFKDDPDTDIPPIQAGCADRTLHFGPPRCDDIEEACIIPT